MRTTLLLDGEGKRIQVQDEPGINGGTRPGAGRPPSPASLKKEYSRKRISDLERHRSEGEFPHEFLLRIVRTGEVDGEQVTLEDRIECAKSAAPFFAPRLATMELIQNTSDEALMGVVLQALTDETFAASLEQFAAAAGVPFRIPRVVASQEGAASEVGGATAGGEAPQGSADDSASRVAALQPEQPVQHLDAAGAVQDPLRGAG